MKTSKRLISALLTLALVLSCFPAITLAVSAVEIEKPDGISIVQGFDMYKPGKSDEETGYKNWIDSMGLPATVKVDGVDTAVEWANVTDYVDPSTPGYYSLPGTVNGVEKAVFITIKVREKVNLLADYDPSFEDAVKYGMYSAWSNDYANKTGYITPVTNPVLDGEYSRQHNYPGTNTNSQITYLASQHRAALAGLVNTSGAGEYCFSAWGRLNEAAVDVHELNPDVKFKLEDGTYLPVSYESNPNMKTDSWVNAVEVLTLPADTALTAVIPIISVDYPNGGNGDLVYLDNLELVNVDVLPAEEPAVYMTTATAETPILGVTVNYDSYVGDWKAGLGLASEAKVTLSDGTEATVSISWDYSKLNLDRIGKYTVPGKIVSTTYGNPNGLSVEQVVYVRPSENLIVNGDFENGRSNWTWNWSVSGSTLEDGNKVLDIKRPVGKTISGSGAMFSTATADRNTLGSRVTVGQYVLMLDGMTVDLPAVEATETTEAVPAVPARDDLKLMIKLASLSGTLKETAYTPINSSDWTRVQTTVDVTSTSDYLYVAAYLTASTNTTGGAALIVDNFQLIQLRSEMDPENLPVDIVSIDAETTPIQIVAGYDKYAGVDWQTELGLLA